MSVWSSIFLDVQLPNATTWFYFSLLLAIAFFVKASRPFSMRNLDVLLLYLPTPGFLLLLQGERTKWVGYLWLMSAGAVCFLRSLLDLTLVRKPALSPNLEQSGLAWFGTALLVSLIWVAVQQQGQDDPAPERPAGIKQIESQLSTIAANNANREEARTWVAPSLTIACHLAIVAGLFLIGKRHFLDAHIGAACACCYLLLPYSFLLLPYNQLRMGRWDDVWPMALIVWAVLGYQRPIWAGFLLGLASGTVYFPLMLFPVWCSFYRGGAGVGRFAVSFWLASALCFAGVLSGHLWITGELPQSIASVWIDWRNWFTLKQPTVGFWSSIPWAGAYRLPVFIAYLALAGSTAFWPNPKNLGQLLALSCALLIGIQFWYAEQGGVYVLWYLPILVLLVFRPNLSERRPTKIDPEHDWLHRAARQLVRLYLRWFKPKASQPQELPVG